MKKYIALICACCLLMATQSFVILSKQNSTNTSTLLTKSPEDSVDNECGCELYIDEAVGFWYLRCKNTCDYEVKAICTFKIHYKDNTTQTFTREQIIWAHSEWSVYNGDYKKDYCEPISVNCEIVE